MQVMILPIKKFFKSKARLVQVFVPIAFLLTLFLFQNALAFSDNPTSSLYQTAGTNVRPIFEFSADPDNEITALRIRVVGNTEFPNWEALTPEGETSVPFTIEPRHDRENGEYIFTEGFYLQDLTPHFFLTPTEDLVAGSYEIVFEVAGSIAFSPSNSSTITYTLSPPPVYLSEKTTNSNQPVFQLSGNIDGFVVVDSVPPIAWATGTYDNIETSSNFLFNNKGRLDSSSGNAYIRPTIDLTAGTTYTISYKTAAAESGNCVITNNFGFLIALISPSR